MGRIRVLPPALVNRIAAGECVERPASVVKELVENALDAGAGRIEVTVQDGGRALIEVRDDGSGMDAEDLRLSVAPHATSKIRSDEDLFNIHTMGFRGEALPSIGAVSRLEIVSRPPEAEVAHRLRVEAGAVGEPVPCPAPPGTTVRVRDLFYCVPVRRKFLRTVQTEMGHVTEQFARIALAYPGVAFTLRHQNRVVHQLEPTEDRLRRLADFYGPELAEVLLPVRREGDGVVVEGYVAPPAHCRRSSKWEYVFVNGRYIRDRFVSHAVKAAYRSLIKPDEYPVVFLFLTVSPSAVDVNVHPTKVEVRWRDSSYVHGQVLAALREKFLTTNLDRPLAPPVRDDEAERERVREAMVDFFTRSRPEPGGVSSGEGRGESRTRGPARSGEATDAGSGLPDAPPRVGGAFRSDPGQAQKMPVVVDSGKSLLSVEGSEAGEEAGTPGVPSAAIQIHNTYLVVETPEGLEIIDQHALHERVLYEQLRRRMLAGSLESQRLLLPDVVEVPADRLEVLETHGELLARLGIELTPVGPQSLAVQAFPALLQRLEPRTFVRDLLDLLSEVGQRPNLEALVHDVLDMMACKAAVKAGDPLTPEEIEALLGQRGLSERSSHCPHGRPTTLRLSLRDLERQFKRR